MGGAGIGGELEAGGGIGGVVAGISGDAGKNLLFSMFHSKFHSHSQYQGNYFSELITKLKDHPNVLVG